MRSTENRVTTCPTDSSSQRGKNSCPKLNLNKETKTVRTPKKGRSLLLALPGYFVTFINNNNMSELYLHDYNNTALQKPQTHENDGNSVISL